VRTKDGEVKLADFTEVFEIFFSRELE